MPFAYYIYFRVKDQPDESLASHIRKMQTELLKTTGIRGRLMKKRGEPLLWMEVYEDVKDAASFETELAKAVKKYRIKDFLTAGSSRKTECFCD